MAAQYAAMATNSPTKGLALWVRNGNNTIISHYGTLYTGTPNFTVDFSSADLDDIVAQYQTSYPSYILGLQTLTPQSPA